MVRFDNYDSDEYSDWGLNPYDRLTSTTAVNDEYPSFSNSNISYTCAGSCYTDSIDHKLFLKLFKTAELVKIKSGWKPYKEIILNNKFKYPHVFIKPIARNGLLSK